MKSTIRLLAATGIVLALLGHRASAQSVKTWTTGDGGDGLFSNTLNWASGTVPVAGNGLVFGATTGVTTLNNDLSITANNPLWQGITFSSGAAAYTINGTAMTMANGSVITNNSAVTQTINTNFDLGSNATNATGNKAFSIAGTGDVVLGGALTQANGYQPQLTMNGQGTLTLTGSTSNSMNLAVNSGTVILAKTDGATALFGYMGNQLNGGVVKLGGTNQFGAGGRSWSVSGGVFDLNGYNVHEANANAGIRSLLGAGGLITNNAAGTGTNSLVTWGQNSSYGGTIRDGDTAEVAVVVNSGRLVLSGSNAYSGGTTLANNGSGTLSIASMQSVGAAGSRNLTFAATSTNQGTLQLTGTVIQDLSGFDSVTYATGANVGLDIQDSANTFTLSGGLTHGGGQFRKQGAGSVVLTGSSTYTGATTLGGGSLVLDASQGGGLGASAPTFSGGGLTLKARSTGTTSQTLGNVTVSAGGGSLLINPNGGDEARVVLGTITATAAGGNFLVGRAASAGAGTAIVTTTSNKDATGIYGGRVLFTTDGGTTVDWATTASGGSPYTLSAYTGHTTLPTIGFSSTVNYSGTGSYTLAASGTANTVKLTTNAASQSLNQGGFDLTVNSGGMLFTGADAYSILAGNLKSNTATNSDLIVHQYGAGTLTISSTITNGVGASTLTKAGPGTLILGASNSYTGQTFVNGGILGISNNNQLGAVATGAQLNLNGGTLRATASVTLNNAGANSRAISVGSAGGGFDVVASSTLNVTGAITAQGQVSKSGSGTLTLSANNYFYGGLRIDEGTVSLSSVRALNSMDVNIGDLAATAALSFGNGNAPTLSLNANDALVLSLVSSNANAIVQSGTTGSGTSTITVYNGADNTYAGILRDGTTRQLALAKSGAGTLILSNSSNTFSGGLTIYNGAVSATQSGALGSGTVNMANGVLRASGSFANAMVAQASLIANAPSTYLSSIDTPSGAATFSGVLSGTGGLIKTGTSALTFSSVSNTFGGSFTGSSGTTSFGSIGASARLTMAGGHFGFSGAASLASLNVSSGDGMVSAGGLVTVGSLTGSGSLNVPDSGWGTGLKLTGSSNTGFSGVINATTANAGWFVLENEGALGTNPDALVIAGGGGGLYFRDNGTPLTVANHRLTVSSGVVVLAPTATSGDMTITGGITGVGGVTYRSQTSRAIVVGGTANDYSGTSVIYTDNANSSTVRLGANDALPSGSGKGNLQFAVFNTGTALLDLGGFSTTINGLSQAGSGAGGRIIDNVSAGGAVTLTLGAGNATGNAFNGIIRNTTGTVAITKIGTGIQTLGGANTYAGATTISGGTLALGVDGSFANSPLITIGSLGSSGAVLDLTAKTGTFTFGAGQTVGGIGTLKMEASDVVNIAGTLSPGNSPGILTFDGGTSLLSGTTQMEIFGSARGTEYDAVDLINSAVLDYAGGTLLLDFGSWLAVEQTYQLFGNGSSSLQGDLFAVTIAGGNYSGLTFTGSNGVWTSTGSSPSGQTLTFTEATGQLVIVPEPTAIALAAVGLLAAGWSWRRRGQRHA